jgi:hypothetical protein
MSQLSKTRHRGSVDVRTASKIWNWPLKPSRMKRIIPFAENGSWPSACVPPRSTDCVTCSSSAISDGEPRPSSLAPRITRAPTFEAATKTEPTALKGRPSPPKQSRSSPSITLRAKSRTTPSFILAMLAPSNRAWPFTRSCGAEIFPTVESCIALKLRPTSVSASSTAASRSPCVKDEPERLITPPTEQPRASIQVLQITRSINRSARILDLGMSTASRLHPAIIRRDQCAPRARKAPSNLQPTI